MSTNKHLHVLSELSAHPISRNVEWSRLIPALSSIGLLTSETNGNYEFTRNGHTVVFEHSHHKVLDVSEVLKLRHFLNLSAQAPETSVELKNAEIVAIDHHTGTVIHNPGMPTESIETFHADLTKGRILHKTKRSPTFSDQNPVDSPDYFDSIIRSMTASQRIVILSHGTGSSSAGEKLLSLLRKEHPEIAGKIVAVRKCDLEAMTVPEIIELGTELIRSPRT